ncbi:DSBA-like thioredoxin domain-containing protein [Alteribacillus iranensis]|uniref:DSBA-like thioredoxin domain-containing protein n=1 Tax=Alteribacillus iranensis TaxID=930128 RepID=A0A1I2E6F0_9BACI|nr:DSBA-like thioredoxin domain-containing protein [Alteribacillus iranensis]
MPADARPPAKPEGYGEGAKSFLEKLVDKTGLTIQPPSEKRSTKLAHIGGMYAKSQGKFDYYHLRIFQAIWEKDENIEDADVLAHIAEEAGLDRKEFMKALKNSEYENLLNEDFTSAAQNKIWTIPSYVGDKGEIQVHHYKDIPSLDELRQIISF